MPTMARGSSVAGGGRPGCGGGGRGCGGVAAEFAVEVGGEFGEGRVVEDEGGGQPQSGGGVEPVAQFDGGQRVEAEVAEGASGVQPFGFGVAEDGGGVGGDEVAQHGEPVVGGQAGQAQPQSVGAAGGAGRGGAAGRAPVQGAQQVRYVAVGAQPAGVEADGYQVRALRGEGRVEEGHAVGGGQRQDTGAADPREVGGVEVAGHGAGVGPQAPGQGGGGQAVGAAAVGEGVEVGVGGGVVGLSGVAEDAGAGGEEDQVGEVDVAGEAVQVACGVGLGGEDGAQPVGGEAFERAVVEGAGRVHHGGERVCGGHGGEGRGELVGVGGVAGGDGDLGAEGGEFVAQGAGAGGVGAAAAGEQQVAHAVPGDEVPGEDAAEGAGAAGDQDGAVGVPGARHGEDDLAVVLGLRHVAEGVAGLVDVPGDGGQGAQGAGGEEPGEVGEHLLDAVLAGLAQFVRLVEGDAGVVAGDLFGVADVGLAHFDEASAGREEPQGGVDEVTGQRVQYDVHAASAAGLAEAVLEVEGAGGGQVVVGPAVGAQQAPLVVAGGAVDLGAPVAGELGGGHADAAGGCVDEDGFACGEAGEVTQAVVGGEEGDGDGGGLGEGPAVGHGGEHAGVGDGVGAEAAGDQAHDAVTGCEAGDAGAGGGDDAGGLGAEEHGGARVHAEGVEDVAEVESGGADLDEDVSGRGLVGDLGAGHQFQLVDGALHRDVEAPCGGAVGCGEGVGGAGAGQPRCVGGALAQGELGFAGGERGGQGLPGVVVDVEVGEDEAAGVLGLGGAQQAPDGGAWQVVRGVAGSGGDGVAGDDDEGHVRGAVVGEPVVDGGQDVTEDGVRRGRRVVALPGVGGDGGRRARHGLSGEQQHGGGESVGVEGGEVGQGGQRGAGAVGSGDGPVRGAEDGPAGGVGGGVGGREGGPVEVEQPVAGGPCGRVECFGGDLADGERVDDGDGRAVRVGQVDGDGVLTGRGDPGAQRGGAGGVQGHAGPGEGDEGAVVAAGGEPGGVQGGVEEGGVDAEPGGVAAHLVGQDDLGEHVVAAAPGGADALEDGAVLVAAAGEQVVEAVGGQGGGAGRRPGGEVLGAGHGGVAGCGEGALGAQGPRVLGVAVGSGGPGVDGDGAAAGVVGVADADLDLDLAVLLEDDGCLEGQVVDAADAEDVTGADDGLDEGGAGDDDGAGHGVVGEPGVAAQGPAGGGDESVTAGEFHGGAEQRVVGRVQSGGGDVAGGVGEAGPVVLPLERVGGEVDAAGPGAVVEGVPVDIRAVRPRLTERQREPLPAALVTTQRPHHTGRNTRVLDRLTHTRRHDRMRTHLHQHPETVRQQRTRRRLELHRPPQIPVPVPRIQRNRVDHTTRHRRVERHLTRTRHHRSQQPAQLRLDTLHMSRMRGIIHRHPARPDPLRLTHHQQLVQRIRVTRHHHRRRPVHRRHRHPALPPADQLPHHRHTTRHRHHAAKTRQSTQRTRTQRHHQRRILQRQPTRHTRRSDLTLRMTHHRSRPHTTRPPHLRQRHHHRPQHGLHHIHPLQRSGTLHTPHHIQQRPLDVRGQGGRALRHAGGEHRRGVEEFHGHPGPLRALAREDEHGARSGLGDAVHDVGGRLAGGERVESAEQVVRAAADDDRTVLHRHPRRHQRMRHVQRTRTGGAHGRRQPRRLLPHRLTRLRRHRPRQPHRTLHRAVGLVGRREFRSLLENQVAVGAADAEGGDAGAAGPAGVRPVGVFGDQPDGAAGPVDDRRGCGDVQAPGHHAVPHREHHLHHAADTRGGLRVTDVRLQRAEQQRPFGVAALSVGGEDGLRLDGVAERRAGAVRLHDVHLGGRESGVGECLPDDALLRGAVGGGEAVGGAVLVEGGAAHHREDGVAVAAGVGEAFQQDEADALGEAHAVGALGERLAAAVGCEAPLPGELHVGLGGGHDGDAAGQGHGALAGAQRLQGQVQGDHGGRAAGVHGDGGALEAVRVGQAAGGDAGGVARHEVAGQLLLGGGAAEADLVVGVDGADEDTGGGGPQAFRVDAGAFERLPGGFEEQALLRVHGEGLARGDPEERRVEAGDVLDEAALAAVGGAVPFGVGVVHRVEVPAAVGGRGGHGVDLGDHQVPQFLGAGDPSREAAGHGDDGHRLVGGTGRDDDGGGGVPLFAEQPVLEVVDDGGGVGVVEQERGGQGDVGGGGDAVAHLDGGERVEAQVLEGAVHVDRVGRGVAQGGGDLGADQVGEQAVLLGGREAAQPVAQGVGVGRGGLGGLQGAADLGEVAEERAGPGRGQDGGVRRPVDVHDGDVRGAFGDGGAQRGDGGVGCHRGEPVVAHPVGEDVGGGHAGVGPGAPGDAGDGQAGGAALFGDGVEVGVRGGVVGLSGVAEDADDGGEQHEHRQVVAAGEFVQVGGAEGLGAQDRVEALRGEGVEDAVVEDARGVDDAGERQVGGQGLEEAGELVAVGDVAVGDGDAGAVRGEVGGEVGDAGRVGSAAAGEDQVPGSGGGQGAGDVGAERAGAAGDQDGVVRSPGAGGVGAVGGLGQRHPGEPAGVAAGGADGELVLRAGEEAGQAVEGARVKGGRQVDQSAPGVGEFEGDGAAEAPRLGLDG
ncbi:hypothetical protein RKD26_006524 [Streptomyces calvus]